MLKNHQWSYWERMQFANEIDILVIGAGIVGYSTALELRKLHPLAKIVILERGNLPSGASSKNAGFACFGSASEIYDDIQEFGEEIVWETVKLRWRGLQALQSQIGDKNLKLQINGSWDLFTSSEMETFNRVLPHLDDYNAKLEEITGEKNVYSVDNSIQNEFGFEQIVSSFKNRLEGQIDTGSMNQSFYQKVISEDIRVLFGCEVTSIDEKGHSALVKTSVGELSAKKVAVCTNGFAKQLLDEDVQPARAQVLITKPIENLNIKGTFHYQKGYYYFRNIDDRILFGGGRNLDFKGETTTEMTNSTHILDSLKEILSTVILPNTKYEIDHSWAGIMGVGNTKKPIIKMISPSIACGIRLGGMGVAIGSLVGQGLAQLISKNEDS
ncbi:MAG: FAD-binding oxidoreductase [Crocinitomicaceae bacterium]|nr:FAD-binding oxidoreductase [Crocinitomicaceae bacterium]